MNLTPLSSLTDVSHFYHKMDRNGDNLSYLKYFGEKSHSLFMQNTDECLEVQDPTLQEPMFTEIDEVSGWPAEGYPILYGSLITEGKIRDYVFHFRVAVLTNLL